jgi:hypothetical protein
MSRVGAHASDARNDVAPNVGELPQWIRSGDGFVTIQVIAKPGASRRRILRQEARGVVVALNSPPSDGRANDELVAWLAELLGTPRSSVEILRGRTARMKTVRIAMRDPARIAAILGRLP